MRGYKPKGKRAARVLVKFIIEVPALTRADQSKAADTSYAPIIKAGTQVQSTNGVIFETVEDLDMSSTNDENPGEVLASQFDANGNPTYYAIRRGVEAVSAKTVPERIQIGNHTPWLRLQLGSEDIQEIVSVLDSEGNEWYEVDYLAQNVVFDQTSNTDSDSETVPYVLKFRTAPRRFVVDYVASTNRTYLQFGKGQGVSEDDELIPNISDMVMPKQGRRTFTNFVLDPQNFLKTRSMGLSPYNTSLTIVYRTGGGIETNVDANTIKTVANPVLDFRSTSLNQPTVDAVRASLECSNPAASDGGGAAETISEIKANADAYFAAQARCVTPEDYIAHVLSMPPRFGKPEKVFVKHSSQDRSSLDIHILTRAVDGTLSHPTVNLRENIKKYLSKLRMLTDGVNILSANIINLGIDFGVVISPRYNRSEVLTQCLRDLKEYFDIDKWQVGQPIVMSEVKARIQSIPGVVSVYGLTVESKYRTSGGLSYANDLPFNVNGNTENGIVYCPQNAIFEIRYPDNDIRGESR
jgi:hypothetical protein